MGQDSGVKGNLVLVGDLGGGGVLTCSNENFSGARGGEVVSLGEVKCIYIWIPFPFKLSIDDI